MSPPGDPVPQAASASGNPLRGLVSGCRRGSPSRQLLRFGCAYEAIADTTCSATTICSRRDEGIRLRVFAAFKRIALESYDRIVVLDQVSAEPCFPARPVPPQGGLSRRCARGPCVPSGW